jgi:hypothetical protein
METFKAEGYSQRHEQLEGWPVRIVSYKLRGSFQCKVDNVDPGAVIARAHGTTREEAEQEAVQKARMRLSLTRRIQRTREVLNDLQAGLQSLNAELSAIEQAAQRITDDAEAAGSPSAPEVKGT